MRRLSLCAGMLLAGCASYQPKPINLETQAQRYEQRTLADAELRPCMAVWPVAQWNRDTLTAAAWCRSPALVQARARLQSALADADGAGLHINPQLQFPFEATLNSHDGGRPYTTGPQFDITLETAGKRGHRQRQAMLLAQAAAWSLEAEKWKVAAQVRDALLAMDGARRRTDLLERQAELSRQAVDMLRKREQAGDTARPELWRAELRQAQLRSESSQAARELLDAQGRLAAALSLPPAALDGVPLAFPAGAGANNTGAVPPHRSSEPALPQSAQARRAAVLRRPDLLAALAEYEASQAALQLEVAKQYPDVHLGAGYAYDAGANKISLGLAGLTLPLFDRNQAHIAQAGAARAEAGVRLLGLQEKIINDIAQADAGRHAAARTLQASAAALALAARLSQSQSASLAAGALDRLGWTQAQADHVAAQADHLRAQQAMLQADAALEDALQHRLDLPIQETNTPESLQ